MRHAASAGALALCLAAMVMHTSHAAPPRAEDFVRAAEIVTARLSPSGRRVAMLMTSDKGLTRIEVLDLPVDKQPPRVVAQYEDARITRIGWVNDNRLVYDATDYSDGIVVKGGRSMTLAVDHDGNNRRMLIAWVRSFDATGTMVQTRALTYEWEWRNTIDDGSDDIIVEKRTRGLGKNWTNRGTARLNTSDVSFNPIRASIPEHTRVWRSGLDQIPNIVQTFWEGRAKLYWRSSQQAEWTLLQDEDYTLRDVYVPHTIEQGRMLISARTPAGESALYTLDLATRKRSEEPLIAVKGFDLDPQMVFDSRTRQLMGLHFRAHSWMSYWFDDDLARIQKSVDAALPKGRSNWISCGRCASSRFVLIWSGSDTLPGEYLLYDRDQRKLTPLGARRPWINEATQGRRSFHRVVTRDGLEIPVYITHPPGASDKEALPAVMLVHGGPWVRGADMMWDEEAQFLATRGYRVIEPEFRGSTGYGSKLFLASIKQRGLAMQDDLQDALQWAVKQGMVDEKRVCIAGASYGGYAALMGPIRHPKDYRCAISFAGVTDLELRYDSADSDLSSEEKEFVLPVLMGSPNTDPELLRKVSPLKRVSEIKVPVLLAHGMEDTRVTPQHAREFVTAARAAGVNVTYVPYDRQAHGWVNEDDKADFYRRMEAFLAQNLAPTAANTPTESSASGARP